MELNYYGIILYMNKILFLIYTILALVFINYTLNLIFTFFNINIHLYGGILAWLNGIVIFFALLPDSVGDTFK